jgi:hypothetical protein
MEGIEILTFDEAIEKSIPESSSTWGQQVFGKNLFQKIMLVSMCFGMFSTNVIVSGIRYLEEE